MKPFPSRDAVDFTAALALGAAIGWSVVTVLRSQERVASRTRSRSLPSAVRGRRRPSRESAFLRELREEAGRLARSAGEELAQTTLSRLSGMLVRGQKSGGR